MSAAEDLVKINEAITRLTEGKQVKELTISGKKIEFENPSVDDLLKLKRACETELSVTNNRRRIRAKSMSGGKGL